MKKQILHYVVVPFISAGISFGLGAIFHDYIFGPLCLWFGFLNSYYMALGLVANYIMGLGFAAVYGYIGFSSGLYGLAIFMIIITTPMQIYGIVNWIKHRGEDAVLVKSLNLKNSIIVTISVIAGSALLGYLLSLIPTQNFAFLDSTSQIINVCGVLMMMLRYRESWYVWLVNNVIDLVIWILFVARGGMYAELTLITSIMYLVMNIIGIIAWVRIERKQKTPKN